MQCFLDTWYCALIRWILWQAKTTLFVGQHLKAKNYTYFWTDGVLYTNLWSQFNKVQQGSPKYKRIALSLCLRLAPVPLASCPPQCASDPRLSALGPPPVPRPASGSSSPTSRPPHLGNGNSASGRPQPPRRPSANAPAPARRRPPLVIIMNLLWPV